MGTNRLAAFSDGVLAIIIWNNHHHMLHVTPAW
jgi:uncharacterized membrane protein